MDEIVIGFIRILKTPEFIRGRLELIVTIGFRFFLTPEWVCRQLISFKVCIASSTADIDALIHQAVDQKNTSGYILLSPDGIPLRHYEGLDYKQVILYANLVCNFALRSKIVLMDLFGKGEQSELYNFRFRTKGQEEIAVACHSDYLFIVIQKCT